MLLGGLGAQVQIALGLLEDPTDGRRSVDLDSARQGIEMLAALEDRTKGNLAAQEARLLSGLLTQLRMAFVEASRQGGAST